MSADTKLLDAARKFKEAVRNHDDALAQTKTLRQALEDSENAIGDTRSVMAAAGEELRIASMAVV